ncbi:DUF1266 domain-containing protein [Streptomyces cacaoi]|uniref:DUF1266 domain-containing protein n=1 Tax=Streptomyces TaxID=1883 RepID=UPI00099DD779|nr:DUF1266 domain-containing protein [Streptomyces cacaoi]
MLGPDGAVRSIAARDPGRASKTARWGRGARCATRAETCDVLERTSAAVRRRYASWDEFPAVCVMGRCPHFDEERFGDRYTTVPAAHRALTDASDSPGNTVPFRLPG